MSVIEEKKALRTFIRKKERTLDPTYKAESSEAICRHLLALDEYKSAKVVFAFASTEKEIDTSLFMNETIAAGKTLILPRCAAEHAIDLCVVRSMDDLEAGAYGILEPKKSCALVTAADIDFAVVPCLSFDRKGRRLGQGGGYYDRLLPQLHCPTVLICREQLMSPEVPVEEHDMRCTMLVTEKGILTLFLEREYPPLQPPRERTRGLPPRPRTLAVLGLKSCTRCAIGCGVHGFAMSLLRIVTAHNRALLREARVTVVGQQTACRMRHCCARRIQRNDRISGRFLVLLSRQVQLGQLRRRMPRMCSPCRGSRSRSLRAYHLENAPICWSSAARLEF